MHTHTFEELRLSGQLPTPSGVGMQILRLTQGDDFSTEEISQAIAADSALTGRLLKIANSAESGAIEPITTIGEATIRLGIRTVRNIALGLSLVSSNRSGGCADFDYDYYWSLSLARAVAAQQLSRVLRVGVPAEMYILGLLGSVGSLALASVHPEAYGEIIGDASVRTPSDYCKAETEQFEIQHREISACMLLDWGLPSEFCKAASDFEDCDLSAVEGGLDDLTLVLRAAEVIGALFLADEDSDIDTWQRLVADFRHLERLSGLEPEAFHKVCNATAAEWREWGQVLGIPTARQADFGSLDEAVQRAVKKATGSASLEEARETNKANRRTTTQFIRAGNDALHVLAVDDDPVTLKMLERHLIKAGHRVTTARDGETALRLALEECPQMVVADWIMPGIDGITLCESLRRIPTGQRIYFLLLTGNEEEDSIVKAFDAGVDDYVTKPFNPRILLARIRAGRRIISLQSQVESEKSKQEKHMMDLQVLTRKLRAAALTDPLTGLSNRRYAMKRLGQAWEAATRTSKPVSVISMDIDHFKKINDTYGHDAGDAVLRDVASIYAEACREEEDVCRVGGEEFLVICANSTAEQAAVAAERLRTAVSARPIRWQETDHHVTMSLGVAVRTLEMEDFEALLKSADQAVYAAKQSGRNRVVIADPGAPPMRQSA